MDLRFDGRVALVTGAGNGKATIQAIEPCKDRLLHIVRHEWLPGLGREYALAFAARGAKVVGRHATTTPKAGS